MLLETGCGELKWVMIAGWEMRSPKGKGELRPFERSSFERCVDTEMKDCEGWRDGLADQGSCYQT